MVSQIADAQRSMLEIIKKEVEYEKERKKQLEARTGTLLGLVLTVITLLVSTNGNMAHNLLHNVYFELYTYSGFWSTVIIILIMISILFFYKAIRDYSKVLFELQQYACVPSESIIKLAYDDKEESLFSLHAAKLIRKVLMKNREINNLKANLFIEAGNNLKGGILVVFMWSLTCIVVGV